MSDLAVAIAVDGYIKTRRRHHNIAGLGRHNRARHGRGHMIARRAFTASWGGSFHFGVGDKRMGVIGGGIGWEDRRIVRRDGRVDDVEECGS